VKDDYGWEKSKQIIVHYSVPKFDVSSELNLADGLKKLGIIDVFDSAVSDFSPLTEDMDGICVSDAKHAARVQIDEEGCTAAAFTQMVADGDAMPPEDEIYFTLDRPFIFVIMSDTNQPLFVGTVYEP
ncbi:MAG: serpin family protein, partial [Oscillospiraceae bacterium]|nr:serpin family protein [Oscillospiraceae bacterium]